MNLHDGVCSKTSAVLLPIREPSPTRRAPKAKPADAAVPPQRWNAMEHFRHQVALIHQLVPPPQSWRVSIGALGTGVVGVLPNLHVPRSVRSPCQPTVGFIVLFLNGPASSLQSWGGKTMGGFKPAVDLANKSLRWQAQRCDKRGRMIAKICQLVEAGGEVVVAVRAATCEPYSILGRTRNFCLDREAQFLVADGDRMVGERGTNRVHKAILAQCLNPSLQHGVGLVACQYPLPKTFFKPEFCTACCWTPATALLTFQDLDEDVAHAFMKGALHPVKAVSRDVETHQGRPRKQSIAPSPVTKRKRRVNSMLSPDDDQSILKTPRKLSMSSPKGTGNRRRTNFASVATAVRRRRWRKLEPCSPSVKQSSSLEA